MYNKSLTVLHEYGCQGELVAWAISQQQGCAARNIGLDSTGCWGVTPSKYGYCSSMKYEETNEIYDSERVNILLDHGIMLRSSTYDAYEKSIYYKNTEKYLYDYFDRWNSSAAIILAPTTEIGYQYRMKTVFKITNGSTESASFDHVTERVDELIKQLDNRPYIVIDPYELFVSNTLNEAHRIAGLCRRVTSKIQTDAKMMAFMLRTLDTHKGPNWPNYDI